MDYCAIPVPAEVTDALDTKGPVLVIAQVNDSEPFEVSLFPVWGGRQHIRIKAKVRQETKTKTGACQVLTQDRLGHFVSRRIRFCISGLSAQLTTRSSSIALSMETAASSLIALNGGLARLYTSGGMILCFLAIRF